MRKVLIRDEDIIVPLKSEPAEQIRRAPIPSVQQPGVHDDMPKQAQQEVGTVGDNPDGHQIAASEDEARTIEAMNRGEHQAVEWPAQGFGNQ